MATSEWYQANIEICILVLIRQCYQGTSPLQRSLSIELLNDQDISPKVLKVGFICFLLIELVYDCECIWNIVQCGKRVRKQTGELFSPEDTLVGWLSSWHVLCWPLPLEWVLVKCKIPKPEQWSISSHAFTFEIPMDNSYASCWILVSSTMKIKSFFIPVLTNN